MSRFHFYSMSSFDAGHLISLSKQINPFLGLFFYVSGVLSNILCSLIFISFKRWKTNPSIIYMLLSFISNLVIFNVSFLSRFVLPNFNLDPATSSLAWCKLRQYLGHSATIISLFCTAWAMVDQYLSTSANIRVRQFSSMKTARYFILITILLSFFQSIPAIIYNRISTSQITNVTSCSLASNAIYATYVAYFVTPFLLGIIPTSIMIVFAILTYTNVNHLHHLQIRTQVQQQLTKMISIQSVLVLISVTIYTVQIIYSLVTASISKSSYRLAAENFAFMFTGNFGYIGYSCSFYIYMLVSPSVRKQFRNLIRKLFHYISCRYYCNTRLIDIV